MQIFVIFDRKDLVLLSIIDNILHYLDEKSLKQTDLCAYIGINTSTMTTWKNRKTDPPAKYIILICEFLDIDPYILLTGKEKSSPTVNLTADEQELLTYYKELDLIKRGQVIERAKVLSEATKTPLKEPKNTIFIEYYDLPVSAGKGVYLDSCDKDMLAVEETALTAQANFALRVSGDSMEPAFHDGDTILVKSQPTVELGEIGIFILNGSGYVKEFGGDCLISLNPEYENMKLTEDASFYCRGKVIGKL